MSSPLVGVVVGSESDRERMQPALDELEARGIAHEFEVRSAHRQPDAVAEYGRTARDRGLRVLIAGAGLAAALPGVLAAHTDLPVIGVPLRSSNSVLDSPSTAFIGVRISWLITARNDDLAWLAAIAICSRSRATPASARLVQRPRPCEIVQGRDAVDRGRELGLDASRL